MRAKYLFTLPFLFLGNLVFAKSTFSPVLLKTVEKYRGSAFVTMKVDKTVKSDLLGTEKKYDGKISLAGEKFRLDTETPEKAMLLFDGHTIWNVQIPPKEFGGKVQVLKSAVSKQNRSQILLSALLDKNSLQKNFKVLKEQADAKKNEMLVTVAPQTVDLTVKTVDLLVDTKKNTLSSVAYTDEVGNLTTMVFSNVEFSKKAKPQIFKYNPPADAQVTNL